MITDEYIIEIKRPHTSLCPKCGFYNGACSKYVDSPAPLPCIYGYDRLKIVSLQDSYINKLLRAVRIIK